MTKAATSDSVRFHRPQLMSGIELVSVCYYERSFPEHSHGEYVFGAVVTGAETLTVAGRSHRVDAGSVLRLHPDQAHANATIGQDALRYHVLYLRAGVLRPYFDCDRDDAVLRFRVPMSSDPTLFAAVPPPMLRSGVMRPDDWNRRARSVNSCERASSKLPLLEIRPGCSPATRVGSLMQKRISRETMRTVSACTRSPS